MLAAAARRAVLDLANAPELPLWNVDTTLVLLLQGLVFWRVGLYRGLWRFASVSDLLNIFKASFIGMVAIVLVLMWKRFDGVPMSVLVIYPFALSALLGAPRLLYRAWKDYQALQSDSSARRVLILGAGQRRDPGP